METIIKKINREKLKKEDFAEAVDILRSGGLVAFPTETVYGLGGNALDKSASAKIYAAKGRPSDNPLIVHIADKDALSGLAEEIPLMAWECAKYFWPGPLTMILKKKPVVPDSTTGGLPTVAIRMPSDAVARMLIAESGLYIAAPSANASGRPSTTRAEHVYKDLAGRIGLILDGGETTIGLESTILDLSGEKPVILRPGYLSREDLLPILPDVEYDPAVIAKTMQKDIVAKAPGMKYRHYAPKGNLTIYEGEQKAVVAAVNRAVEEKMGEGYTCAVLATEETKGAYTCPVVKSIGGRAQEEIIAARLFDVLRSFDDGGVEYIFSESFPDGNLGPAIMNRLLKAAGYQVIYVGAE
ncbi:MAG: threonylcarbamoyl-AMP synthase [Lachnospiraceae bacterium]|nr:threonylcarbamoyl-AMP synthase [Lachnospiraceae bacterium]